MRVNYSVQAPARRGSSEKTVPTIKVTGPAKCGRRTKALAKRLNRGDIAVIDHEDLDSVAAQMLVEKAISGVVNLHSSISGRYPNRGPSILLQAGIPLLDIVLPELMDTILDGARIDIEGNQLSVDGAPAALGELQTYEIVEQKLLDSRENLDAELRRFAENTLHYASIELTQLLSPVVPPSTSKKIQDKHALIVVRGEGYKRDLEIIAGYIKDKRPVLIAVDGGADALLEMGLKPDVIIGDMDSVSDEALRSGAEVVVHTYMDGRQSPGEDRIREMGIRYEVFPVPGTSEDAAMLFAFEHGAGLIVAVGTHTNLYDYLDKGRRGMASTMLVRMRIGSKLVDARGVSKLYTRYSLAFPLALIAISALLLVGIVILKSDAVRSWLMLLYNSIRIWALELKNQ